MLRRKDSFGYIDFVRGKYSPYNISQIQDIVNEMSLDEKQRILTKPFETLWKNMWGDITTNQYKAEESASMKKMEIIQSGVNVNDEFINLEQIVKKSNTNWIETEWEFPKGRRNHLEKELDCALREFEEETGYSNRDLKVIENLLPFEEIFIGSNNKSYKHKYFIAFTDKITTLPDNYQITEVSKLEWKTLDKCLESIRPYHLEKRQLITNVNRMLQEYRVY